MSKGEPTTELLRFTIPRPTAEKLRRRAAQFDSMASYLRHIVRVYLTEHRDD